MKAVARVSRPTAADAEKKQLKAFIDKFEPKHQALIRAVRRALRKRLPSAHELIYDNHPCKKQDLTPLALTLPGPCPTLLHAEMTVHFPTEISLWCR